jgi:ABC-type multidrug transport system ATPase subunit
METVLQIKNLRKSFGKKQVLTGVSFDAYEGQCIGLLGPNGAGKSTVSKLITKLIDKDEGKILVLNKDQDKDFQEIKKYISLVPQDFAFYFELTVKENLEYFAKAYNVKNSKERVLEIIKLLNLSKFTNTLSGKMSGGYKRLLNIAVSLIHDPKLILLDEPTVALDADMRIKVWEVIELLKKQGKTLILTTHYLDEAQRLCDKIAILKDGRIILFDSPKGIQENFAGNTTIKLVLKRELTNKTKSLLEKKFKCEFLENHINLITKSNSLLDAITEINILVGKENIKSLDILIQTLEDAFENIIKE